MRKLLSVLIVLILVSGCCTAGAAEAFSTFAKPETSALTLNRADEIPSWGWQKTASFPDWKNC